MAVFRCSRRAMVRIYLSSLLPTLTFVTLTLFLLQILYLTKDDRFRQLPTDMQCVHLLKDSPEQLRACIARTAARSIRPRIWRHLEGSLGQTLDNWLQQRYPSWRSGVLDGVLQAAIMEAVNNQSSQSTAELHVQQLLTNSIILGRMRMKELLNKLESIAVEITSHEFVQNSSRLAGFKLTENTLDGPSDHKRHRHSGMQSQRLGTPKVKQSTAKPRRIKKILYWTTFFGKDDFWLGYGRQPFLDHNCEVTECETTSDHSQYNSSDAVIMHMRDLSSSAELPKYRFPWQQWIFFLMEPPHNFWIDIHQFDGMFNLTQTYRLDSDIRQIYGWIKKRTPAESASFWLPADFARGKKKLVAWFVSNCEAPSRRLQYTRELQKYIDVDIYGKCGNLSCTDINGCFSMLNTTYKFYLSFENNICRDYATEKLWSILKLNVVPIVLGGFEYKKYLPSHSFIDVADFKSPRDLAEYLKLLDSNDQLYNAYFEWKRQYVVDWPYHMYSFCDLCKLLNTQDKRHKWYEKLDDWWSEKRDCTPVNQYWTGHADFLVT